MRSNQKQELGSPPDEFPHDPTTANFPSEWKDVAWRRLAGARGEIECPICSQILTYAEFRHIHMDHFWPRSLMGDSSWHNLRLLCADCNVRRSNFIESELRLSLAKGPFRKLVSEYLASELSIGNLTSSIFLEELLARLADRSI